jgi:type IV secretory pathway TraG/TraD family ATPase VirD4
LSQGGYSELKDKIITLKDEWENDYYRTIAEDYLQTTLEVLIKLGRTIDLKTVSNCLDFENLVAYIREANDKGLAEKVKQLQHYKREALTGLQAHFNVLINSELGQYLASDSQAFNLNAIIENKAVAYFALPALKFPSFAKMVGKLIINDIKTAIEPLESKTPIFIIFDEFSVFAGEQVLNLINMGRGKGVHAILGTQGLADLKKVNSEFESQLLNCVNTVICHRLNHQECAETIAKWIGTQDSYDITAQINLDQNQSRLGSATKNKAFHVHPDEIKQHLKTGEAIYVSKVHDFIVDTVKIKL